MVKELVPIDDEYQRRRCFRRRIPTLFAIAKELSQDFGAHVAVVAFSPTDEPHAFGADTADSILRAYLPDASPPPAAPSPGAGGEGAARVDGIRRELEETKGLVAAEWARVAAATGKIRAAQASAGKRNWWEVDVEALGEEELPVFVKALEMLRDEVQSRVDGMASARPPLPWKEKQQQ